MKLLADIENWMVEAFKGMPQLSKKNKELFVQALPWVVLVFGALQVLSLFGAWEVIREIQRREAFLGFLGATSYGGMSTMIMYVSFVLSVVSAVMLLLAYAPLRARARRGWQLVFIVTLINAFAGLLALFIYGQGIGAALLNIGIAAIFLYLLMQVRDAYKGAAAKDTTKKRSKKSSEPKKSE